MFIALPSVTPLQIIDSDRVGLRFLVNHQTNLT